MEPEDRMNRSKWTWKNVDLPAGTVEQLSLDFEKGVLEETLVRVDWERADNREIELLAQLGDLYSRLGKLHQGLEVDKTLVRIRPDEPIFLYNLACSYSRLGDIEPAFVALEAAVRRGYQNFDHLRKDHDLDNLKKDARFHKLLEQFDSTL